jgi:hypothetical protein
VRHGAGRKHQQRTAIPEPAERPPQRRLVALPCRGAAERIDVNHQRVEFRYPAEQMVRKDAQIRPPRAQRLRQRHALDAAEGVVRHHDQRSGPRHARQLLRIDVRAYVERRQRRVEKVSLAGLLPGAAVQVVQPIEPAHAVGGGDQRRGDDAGHAGRA